MNTCNAIGKTRRQRMLLLLLLIGVSVAGGTVPVTEAADSQVVNFNITVLQGTCTVSVEPTVPLNTVDGSALVNTNWRGENLKAFSVSLTQCAGTANPATQPVLTLQADAVRANTNSKVFYTAAGTTSTGFGVAVYNRAAPTPNSDVNMVANGGVVWSLPKGQVASNTAIPLSAAVTCGPISACAAANLKAGSLKAHVTFTFKYQ